MTDYKFEKGDRVEALRDSGRVRKGDRGTVMEAGTRMSGVKWDRVIAPRNEGLNILGEPAEHVWSVGQDDIRLIAGESSPTVRNALLNAKQAIGDALDMLGGES